MNDPPANTFGRRRACPDAETLLAFNTGALAYLAREQVASHLLACDFCRACTQLLSHLTPPEPAARTQPAARPEQTTGGPTRAPLCVLLLALARKPSDEGSARARLTRAA
jgi:hypothetical protein